MPVRLNYNNLVFHNESLAHNTYTSGTAIFTSMPPEAEEINITTTINNQPISKSEITTGLFTLSYDFSNDFRGSGAKFIEILENEFLGKVHNKLLSCIRDTREYTVKIFNKTKYKYNEVPYPYNRLTIEIAILLLNYDDAEIGDSVRVFGVIPNASLMVDSKERVWELHSKDDVHFYTRIK